jgi:hypothetical protein
VTVDDDEANGLLRHIVGWIHAWGGNETEVGFAMKADAIRHILCVVQLFLSVVVECVGYALWLLHRRLKVSL